MMTILYASAVLVSVVVALASASSASDFDDFVAKYKKVYATQEERELRRGIFQQNADRVASINRESTTGPTAGVTKFFDMTPVEFKKKFGQLLHHDGPTAPASYTFEVDKLGAIPKRVDWRKEGAVTPVPNEGECGSIICGFGFATNVEGVNKIVNGKLVALSAQEAMACVEETCGCFLRDTYEWFLQNQSGWVDTEVSWPYDPTECEVAVCDLSNRVRGAQISQVVSIPSDEKAIQAEVAMGPVTVAVNAMSWQTYTGGVMSNCVSGQPDHVATIVGYNEDATPTPYWILKNWWSADWGIKGYIYLAMGTNQCNITYEPLTVRVA